MHLGAETPGRYTATSLGLPGYSRSLQRGWIRGLRIKLKMFIIHIESFCLIFILIHWCIISGTNVNTGPISVKGKNLPITLAPQYIGWACVCASAYPLQVQRRKQPRDTTFHGIGVWPTSYPTGPLSAAWQSHYSKHPHPPWEGERGRDTNTEREKKEKLISVTHFAVTVSLWSEKYTPIMNCQSKLNYISRGKLKGAHTVGGSRSYNRILTCKLQ